jgi:hypothetical protein
MGHPLEASRNKGCPSQETKIVSGRLVASSHGARLYFESAHLHAVRDPELLPGYLPNGIHGVFCSVPMARMLFNLKTAVEIRPEWPTVSNRKGLQTLKESHFVSMRSSAKFYQGPFGRISKSAEDQGQ